MQHKEGLDMHSNQMSAAANVRIFQKKSVIATSFMLSGGLHNESGTVSGANKMTKTPQTHNTEWNE